MTNNLFFAIAISLIVGALVGGIFAALTGNSYAIPLCAAVGVAGALRRHRNKNDSPSSMS